MKHSTQIFIAVAIALLSAVVAVGVWAGSGRLGTVPDPPDGVGCPSGGATTFGTGTIRVAGTDCNVTVKQSSPFGNPPKGWSYLLPSVMEVKVVSGSVSQVEVCVPLNPDWKNKVAGESINFFYWNAANSAWIAVPTVVKNNETPPVVCGTSASAGFYAVFGK
jgi:hypothetical protein